MWVIEISLPKCDDKGCYLRNDLCFHLHKENHIFRFFQDFLIHDIVHLQ
jgi:hypothetical protein